MSRAEARAQSQWRVSTDTIKWVASIVHILAYVATAMEATPLNMYLFCVSIGGWFIVGVRWNDRAIVLIHAVAAAIMLGGVLSA